MLNEKIKEVLENLGWKVIENGDGTVTTENWSPAGEHLIVNLSSDCSDKVKEELYEFYWNYDCDEHLEDLARLKINDGVEMPSLRRLAIDVEEIEKMYSELCWAIRRLVL